MPSTIQAILSWYCSNRCFRHFPLLRGLPVHALSYTSCRGGVATGVSRNCCKMRCQTSHLTMQTSKWAAVRLCLFICLRPPSLYPPTLYPPVCTLSICPSVCRSVCLSVGLFGLVFAWLSVKTDGLKAQGCCRCRSWRCTCASSSRTPLAAAAPAVCASQTEASRRGEVWRMATHTKRKTRAAKNNSVLSEK